MNSSTSSNVHKTGDPEGVSRAIRQPVVLADYDPRWPAMFADERRRLMDTMPGTFVAIEHIGSTAVPGMRSKPLIDLLAGVRTMDEAFALNALTDRFGYTTSPQFNAGLTTRQWFMRQTDGQRTHHLHVVVYGSRDWSIRIDFRDRLLAEPTLCAEYLALKEDLARRFANDRDAYTDGKSAFITAAIRESDRP